MLLNQLAVFLFWYHPNSQHGGKNVYGDNFKPSKVMGIKNPELTHRVF
jgi:hypothetical protein